MPELTLVMLRCESCEAEFAPRPGPCPRCGGVHTEPFDIDAGGQVLAATELEVPSAGWTAPHRLALVEVAGGIRLLCIVRGSLPAPGDGATVTRDGETYRIG